MNHTYVAVVVLDDEGVLVGRWAGRPGLGRTNAGRAQGPPGGVIGRALRLRAPQVVGDVTRDPDYVPDVPGSRSEMAIPLIEGSEVLGILDFQARSPLPSPSTTWRPARPSPSSSSSPCATPASTRKPARTGRQPTVHLAALGGMEGVVPHLKESRVQAKPYRHACPRMLDDWCSLLWQARPRMLDDRCSSFWPGQPPRARLLVGPGSVVVVPKTAAKCRVSRSMTSSIGTGRPRSRSRLVTPRPRMPQGTIRSKADRSVATLKAKPCESPSGRCARRSRRSCRGRPRCLSDPRRARPRRCSRRRCGS